MADSTTTSFECPQPPDDVRVRRWAAAFVLYLLLLGLPAAILLGRLGRPWTDLFAHPEAFTSLGHQALKLLIFTAYVSLACTFLPMPTGWLITAMASQYVALTGGFWSTTLLVALCGGVGSTMANLNDYHLFTLLLRLRWIARVRTTRLYRLSSAWFERSPFLLLVVFNVIPIPVDVVRMLATSHRYGRVPFAAANFIGRFIRYWVFAAVTYALPAHQKHVVIGMFALTVVLALVRLTLSARRSS